MIMKHFFAALVFLSVSAMAGEGARLAAKALPDLPDPIGVAGPFVGVHNDALIVAGGANFPVRAGGDLWEVPKVYHANAWVLMRKGDGYEWLEGFKLKKPVGYGMCVSTDKGVVCIGGQTGETVYSNVFRLEWDAKTKTLKQSELPALPVACTGGAAAVIGDVVYVAGGQSEAGLDTATKNFWRLDLTAKEPEWEKLPSWPGPARAFNQMVAQHNGREMCLYVFGGRRQDAKVEGIKGIIAMSDVYEFGPKRHKSGKAEAWRKRKASPKPIMAGTAVAVGQSHVFVVGGADGEGLKKIAADTEFVKKHSGFPKRAWAYHTITDTWIDAGPLPANHVTTPAVKWGDDIIIASGEIKPRVRSAEVWRLTPIENKKPFGAINFTVLALYLLAMVGVGVWFMRKNKTTDDYFRGGQNIPWWAAACSIYATMLSSLTFVALPALVYATDWLLYIGMLMIPAVAPLAIYGAMPFFRRIDATSAYEYLGKRFNRPVRLLGSGLFTLFHISRMGIVMALTALALSAVTPLTPWQSVLIMGVLCLIYCTMGGVEAVIWTDTIQTVVLLGGALVCVFYIIGGVDGGFGGVLDLANANDKMTLVNLDFSPDSFTVLALWVVILGGIGQNLSSYTSDQAVVQRYMTTKSTAAAARAIWANGIMAVLGSLLFFFIGTGLYAFYHSNPMQLNPTIQNDQVFPMFIATELPVGIAGLIVAGIFAAAQSTVSTSMNSTATTLVTDFLRPFNRCDSEAGYLKAAKVLTFTMGVLGTLAGLVFINPEIRSLMSEYFKVIGMFMGALGGLFLLGILTTRAHARGAFIGLLGGVAVMIWIWRATETSGYIYAFIGISSCLLIGYAASVLLPSEKHDLENLTLHTLTQTKNAND
jgi:solute:Na+ symporter, SSS family